MDKSSSDMVRYSGTVTLSGGPATVSAQPFIEMLCTGEVVDFTVATGGVTWELAASPASQPILPPPGQPGIASTNSCRGLSIIERTTNEVRNPRYEGGTAGVPGTFPPGFSANTTGMNREIVGFGTEDGIPYIDLRVWGVPTLSYWTYTFGSVPVTLADTVTFSGFFKVVAGVMPGIITGYMRQTTTGESGFSDLATRVEIPTGGRLIDGTFVMSRALTRPNVDSVACFMQSGGITVGTPIDVTYRIGAAQIEKRAYATPIVLPPVGAQGASIGLPDYLTPKLEALAYRAEGSTFIIGATLDYPADSGSGGILRLQDTVVGNNHLIMVRIIGTNLRFDVYNEKVSLGSALVGTVVPGVPFVLRLTWGDAYVAASLDGAPPVVKQLNSPLTGMSRFCLGCRNYDASDPLGGVLSRFDVAPVTASLDALPTFEV